MTLEAAIGGGATSEPSGAGANLAGGSPPSQDTSPALEQTAGGATAGDVQGQSPTQQEANPFEGVPSVDELNKLVEQGTPHAKSLIQLRQALEARNTQFTELESKYRPLENFQSHLERFEKPEDLQQIVDFREKLYGWEPDPHTGQLVPATQSLVQELTKTAPDRADFLSADLLNGMTKDPDTGREMTRMDLALEAIAEDPSRRAKALQILGGVEPNSIAPTWQPTAEELAVIPEELQDTYKKLPYDKRQALNSSDPEVVKDYLEDQKFKADVRDRDARTQAQQKQTAEARDRYMETEATNAGNQIVEAQFREGFTGFAKNICEKFQPIKPIDPQSPEAQAMAPEQVAQTNAQIQKVNRGAGLVVSMVTAALAHPETSFLAREFVKEIGITDEMLQKFDTSRQEFATNNRNFGYLSTKAKFGQNGNGNGTLPQDIGMLQTQAQRAQRSLMANGNAVAGPLMQLLTEFFSLQATSHNQTLNGAATARPSISGTGYDPTQVAQQRQRATTEAEVMQRARESANSIAARR